MESSNLLKALNIIKNFSFKGYLHSKSEIQCLIDVLEQIVQGLEEFLSKKSTESVHLHLKLCLLQLRETIKQIFYILEDCSYLKKTDIVRLLLKKIDLCLNEIVNDGGRDVSGNSETSFQVSMSKVRAALKSCLRPTDFNVSIDALLCSSLTIGKLSTDEDFKEISSCCRNVLRSVPADEYSSSEDRHDFDGRLLSHELDILERRVNSAMLRLFLHTMSYPQENLKRLIKGCGKSLKSERYSEDIEEEVSAFDVTCERIGMMGHFAITSCDDDSLKLKVKNCLANLEFYEESLVPACIDFYLDPTNDKRELLKYLCTEWKSQVQLVDSLLDRIVDPAAFSLVVCDDLSSSLAQSNEGSIDPTIIDRFHPRCRKLVRFLSASPDCVSASYLGKSLESELELLEKETCGPSRLQKMQTILALIDRISEHLNRTLMDTTSPTDVTAVRGSEPFEESAASHSSLSTSTWGEFGADIDGEEEGNVLEGYLSAAFKSPSVFTLYQKTPVKTKLLRSRRRHVSLHISDLGESYEA